MNRRLALFAFNATLPALLAAPIKTLAFEDKTAMDDALSLFAIVDHIIEARPFTATAIGRLVGGTLAPVGQRSTPYVLLFEAQGTPEFDRVELRLKGPNSTNNGQFLILDVNAKRCVGKDDVQTRYGRQPELSVPTPRQPADSPIYFKYRRDWGALSFGFARTGAECLSTVVIDVESTT
jgi:hypothetical protein